jgi:hypothetical protein
VVVGFVVTLTLHVSERSVTSFWEASTKCSHKTVYLANSGIGRIQHFDYQLMVL